MRISSAGSAGPVSRPRVGARSLYAEDLSRRVYAGADLFLMPSRSEPCGLSQMIAMRYGAVPIVREHRRSGGHRALLPGGAGGRHRLTCSATMTPGPCSPSSVRPPSLYRGDRTGFDTVRYRGMTADFSWGRSAAAYRHIYENL